MAVVELNRVGSESAAVPLRGIREALRRLRAVESTLQMLDRVTAEVCRSCGFDRCVFFRLDGASLTPEGAHFVRLADLLTRRELEVVELIARGATNADISA